LLFLLLLFFLFFLINFFSFLYINPANPTTQTAAITSKASPTFFPQPHGDDFLSFIRCG
ncbi:unnamed protein product, partial [Arabidopsis halleri]